VGVFCICRFTVSARPNSCPNRLASLVSLGNHQLEGCAATTMTILQRMAEKPSPFASYIFSVCRPLAHQLPVRLKLGCSKLLLLAHDGTYMFLRGGGPWQYQELDDTASRSHPTTKVGQNLKNDRAFAAASQCHARTVTQVIWLVLAFPA